ncbi:MAG: protein kinase domain-containing protein [Myxococcota bacterium]
MTTTMELTDGDRAPRRREPVGDPLLGRQLMHYRVVEQVGQGGMSVVYRGRDERLERDVAIKVLHPFLAQKSECRARLAREARAVARLEHDNILKVFDYSGEPSTLSERPGGPDQDPEEMREGFLVCEFVPGETLRHAAEHDRYWQVPEVGALVVARIARALQHAHEQGVIHRDVKPENIMLRSDGVLKLMDFGIAQVVDQKQLTITGTLLGSPAHMAPESIEGLPCDERSDLFSLGTVLYWLTTGVLPFEAPTPHALLRAIVEAAPPPAQQRAPRVSDDLARVIARAMARRPVDRYASAAELAAALESVVKAAGLSIESAFCAELLVRPEEGLARARGMVREAFLDRARALLDEGARARAIACLARVMADHPEDAAAAALLEQAQIAGADDDDELHGSSAGDSTHARTIGHGGDERLDDSFVTTLPRSSRSLGRYLLPTALIAFIAAVAMVGAWVARALPEAAARARGIAKAPAADPSGSLASLEKPGTVDSPSTDPSPAPVVAHDRGGQGGNARRPGPKGPPQKRPPPLLRRVRVVASPWANIFVDGVEVARNAIGRELSLAPGRHEVRFEHDFAKTQVREVDVPAEGMVPELRVSLDEAKPAYLRVRAEPLDAEIAVEGLPKGAASESLERPIVVPFPRLVARTTAEVMVYRPGYRTRWIRPELEAGQTVDLQVVLEPDADGEIPRGDGERRPIGAEAP